MQSLGLLPGSSGPLPAVTTTSQVASLLEGLVGVRLRRRQVRRPLEFARLQGFLNQGCGFLAFPLRTGIWGRAQLETNTVRAKDLCGDSRAP